MFTSNYHLRAPGNGVMKALKMFKDTIVVELRYNMGLQPSFRKLQPLHRGDFFLPLFYSSISLSVCAPVVSFPLSLPYMTTSFLKQRRHGHCEVWSRRPASNGSLDRANLSFTSRWIRSDATIGAAVGSSSAGGLV